MRKSTGYKFLDLSNNNFVPQMADIKKAGYEGFWHKVSEGTSFVDHDFGVRSRYARGIGLRVGGYHFARPKIGNAFTEAVGFCHALGDIKTRDLRPVLDLETNDDKMSIRVLEDWARHFVQSVSAITGVCPMLYSYPDFLESMKLDKTIGCGLWIASYGANNGLMHPVSAPHPWKKVHAHQFTSRGTVPGVSGDVDLTYAPSLSPLLAHGILGRLV